MSPPADSRRSLPAVDVLGAQALDLDPGLPVLLAMSQARAELDRLRRQLDGNERAPSREDMAAAVALNARLLMSPSPRGVVNATGVIVHTNLGRAPLSDRAIEALQRAARGYSDLEYDLDSSIQSLPQKLYLDHTFLVIFE